MAILVFRDLRLEGKYVSDLAFQPVDEAVTLKWMVNRIQREKGKVQLQIWSHGLPGYVMCGKGSVAHPTAGPGLTIHDLSEFAKLAGKVSSIEIHSCLVARIGTSPECNGHVGYDGNWFCSRLAQVTKATVAASWDIQFGSGNQDCGWAGAVLTYGSKGNVLKRENYPMSGTACVDY